MPKKTKTQIKIEAQDKIMYKIADLRGYFREGFSGTEAEADELDKQLEIQADRVAKLFGYDKSWAN